MNELRNGFKGDHYIALFNMPLWHININNLVKKRIHTHTGIIIIIISS